MGNGVKGLPIRKQPKFTGYHHRSTHSDQQDGGNQQDLPFYIYDQDPSGSSRPSPLARLLLYRSGPGDCFVLNRRFGFELF
jgi:hypothetical protein